MTLLLTFGVVLVLSVAFSGLAARTMFSVSLLCLVAGAFVGRGGLGLTELGPSTPLVSILADIALFTVLFTDSQRASLPTLKTVWRLSGRALLLGMPLAMVGVALLARLLLGFDWVTCWLLGAILAPTDPVFASAIVTRQEVPSVLRDLLNVESGLNDGLALPFVLVFLALAAHHSAGIGPTLEHLVEGVGIGVAIPLLFSLLRQVPGVGVDARLGPLGPLAVGLMVYATCHLTGSNAYLGAFSAGATLATTSPRASAAFERFGDLLAELTKFAALLVFGALLTPGLLGELTVGGWAVAVLAIVVVRPLSLLVSLAGARLPRRERLAAAWFGPKGFASVVYALVALGASIPKGEKVFAIVAATIGLSIAAHTSTDVPIARMYHVEDLVSGEGTAAS